MRMIAIYVMSMLLASILVGCISHDPQIEPTKPWEGRYTSLEEASKVLDAAATTENDNQVWILQPSTLSRLLKNTEK